jgi:hypothetical protein
MLQTDKPIKPFIEYIAEYIVKKLKGATPDEIVYFYVDKFIFRNPKTFDYLIEYYKLPKKDLIIMHKRLEELVK